MKITPFGSLVSLVVAAFVLEAGAQTVTPNLFHEMHWRNIGPFRGGRTRAAAGVPGQPNVFYMGQVNGGVWKTDDAGRTWAPIFDAQPTQSIGAIAVAPSNPQIIYVASAEGLSKIAAPASALVLTAGSAVGSLRIAAARRSLQAQSGVCRNHRENTQRAVTNPKQINVGI